MKHASLLVVLGSVLLLGGFGCSHLDLAAEGDPNRVLTGTVNVRMNLLPPPDTELVVRLVEPPDVTASPTAPAKDLVIGERGSREQPERVVAEQVTRAPSTMPVPFRIEFRASDARLVRGLNIEARISWGGRLRFRNLEAQVVTLSKTNTLEPQTIWVEPVQ